MMMLQLEGERAPLHNQWCYTNASHLIVANFVSFFKKLGPHKFEQKFLNVNYPSIGTYFKKSSSLWYYPIGIDEFV